MSSVAHPWFIRLTWFLTVAENRHDNAKEFHTLEGLDDEELERYLDENPYIMPLFEIDVGGTMETYASPVDTTSRDQGQAKRPLWNFIAHRTPLSAKSKFCIGSRKRCLNRSTLGRPRHHGPSQSQ